MFRSLRTMGGTYPVKDGYVAIGQADIANNIDIKSDHIRSLKNHSTEQTGMSTTATALHYYNDRWIADNGYHVNWWRDGIEIHIYTDSAGTLKLQVGYDVDNLGVEQPDNPASDASVVGLLTGAYAYVVIWKRSMDSGNYLDISQPNDTPVEVDVTLKQVTLTRPALPVSSYITHWEVYRTTDNGANYYLLDTLTVGTTTFTDNAAITDATLRVTANLLQSYYISAMTQELGISIFWEGPATELEGIAGPMNGCLYGWKKDKIYISEPGYPQAWPSQYVVSVGSPIKRIIVSELYATVITDDGTSRLDYTKPEIADPNKTMGNEGCLNGRTGVSTNLGVLYLADSGISRDDGSKNEIKTNDRFDERWFLANVDPTTASMNYMDDLLYLFHSTETLIIDARIKTSPKVTTLSIIVQASWQNHETGELYVLSDGVVYKLYGATAETDTLTWTWKSGKILKPDGSRQWDPNIEVKGSGTVIGRLYMDGVQVGSDMTFTWATEWGRFLQCPDGTDGREFQFELKGSDNAEVTNIKFEVH